MALKRFYNFQEAKKLILEDSSDSDDDSDVELDSDSSNGNYVPDSDNRSDNSSDECAEQVGSALVCSSRGRGRGRRGGTPRGSGSHADAGFQGSGKQEGSAVVCSGRGRGRGRRGGPSRGRGSQAGTGDQDGGNQEGSAVACGDRGKATGGRAGTVMGRGVPGDAGDMGVVVTESVVADDSVDPPTTLSSKNGDIIWMTQPIQQVTGRRAAQNVMHMKPGPTRFATRNVDSPKSAFQLFMRDPVLNEIEKWTNIEGKNVYADNWKNIVREELLCYLGILILIGVYRAKNEPICDMWNRERGRAIISGSMARDRFQQISRVLRFDDASTRRARRTTDKLAPIRNLFDMWEVTLEDAFVPFEHVTVDEQLLTYRGRCPFIQYIPSKPGKYGIKFWAMCDSKTSYVCRVQVYTGRQPDTARETNQGQRVVQEMCRNLAGSGRNVTCDNFFTSLQLIQNLKKDKMTLLGTVRKNRSELPPELVTVNGRGAMSTLFAYHNDAMIASYCPKKGKVVTLMSSLHSEGEVDVTNPKKKPTMILEYNATKGGVDTADKMLRTYSTKRMTRRWPVAVFSNMLDISALDAYIVWILINPHWNANRRHKRRLFLHELGKVNS